MLDLSLHEKEIEKELCPEMKRGVELLFCTTYICF